MTEQLETGRRRRPRATTLSMVEILVLAPLAALLAFWLVPAAFDVEWSCVGGLGPVSSDGEAFAQTLAVFGSAGWLVVLLGTLFALIAERDRLAAILPIAWFVVLVAAMTIAAASVGPAPCPA